MLLVVSAYRHPIKPQYIIAYQKIRNNLEEALDLEHFLKQGEAFLSLTPPQIRRDDAPFSISLERKCLIFG